jgi:hypothetical protein
MNKRYKIISPNINDKIIQTSSLNKCAKYCYNQIKQSGIKSNSFSIKDIDTSEIFTFAIHPKNNHFGNLVGGADGAENDNVATVATVAVPTVTDITEILKKIEQRIDNIEKKLEIDSVDVCSIM